MTMIDTITVPSQMPGIAAVIAGGCVEGGRRFRRRAHAHNHKTDKHFGTICFLGRSNIWTARGEPSRVFWHEYAHILTPNHSHDDVWRAKMRDLGQPIPIRYAKRERGVTRSGHRHNWQDHGPSQVSRGMTDHTCSECGAWKLKRAATVPSVWAEDSRQDA